MRGEKHTLHNPWLLSSKLIGCQGTDLDCCSSMMKVYLSPVQSIELDKGESQ
jgi:hypothetical protein